MYHMLPKQPIVKHRTAADILVSQANVLTVGLFVGLLTVLYCTVQLHSNKVLIRETGETLTRIEEVLKTPLAATKTVTLACYLQTEQQGPGIVLAGKCEMDEEVGSEPNIGVQLQTYMHRDDI